MDAIALIPAQQLSVAQLASLVSRAYSDYYYHVSVTETQFHQTCLEEDVDLSQSVAALCGGNAVGLALLSRRAERGRISAVGVLPVYRRQGIARAMILDLQHRSWSLGLRAVTLEVLEQNQPGLALYAQLGFVRSRELLLLVLAPHTFVRAAPPEGISEASPSALLAHFEAFHPVLPSWQREMPTLLRRLPQLTGLSCHANGALVGYALFQPQRSYQLIHDLAVAPSAAQPLATAEQLLRAVHYQRPNVGGYVINAVADDPLLPAYAALRYRAAYQQYELVWKSEVGC